MSDKTFSIEEFRDFCAGKPKRERYSIDANHCALAQFGFPGAHDWSFYEMGIPQAVFDAAMGGDEPDRNALTWGSLASRLSNLIGEGGNG